MNYIHKNLAGGRWFEFLFMEQMANIGAEIGRAINWQGRDEKLSQLAFERGLELLDLTIYDPKNRGNKYKELCCPRETLVDYFMGENQHGSTDKLWNNYFLFF